MSEQDTIVAIATPPGHGSVGIVRLSGAKVPAIAEAMLGSCPKPRHAWFTEFHDQRKNIIDQGIALYFQAPNSFTGDDVLEFQAHGGPVVLDQLLATCLALGARLAEPGEFSKVAYLNGKMDLAQAEAIADLINATSTQAAQGAIRSLQGEFSRDIDATLKRLIECRMHIEASIDFPDEDIDLVAESSVLDDCRHVVAHIDLLLANAEQGALLQEGITVVIAGRPNAGKSSLLNALSGEQTAIVTSQAGTTRDVLRERIHIDGLPLHIIDTAGIRDSDDVIEQEGIRRAWQQIAKADLILLLVDAQTLQQEPVSLQQDLQAFCDVTAPILIIKNKVDLTEEALGECELAGKQAVAISAKQDLGLETLKGVIKQLVGYRPSSEGNFLARRRHVDALKRTQRSILSGLAHFEQSQALELFADDLLQAQHALAEITGAFHADDLLGEIFSSFCIGK